MLVSLFCCSCSSPLSPVSSLSTPSHILRRGREVEMGKTILTHNSSCTEEINGILKEKAQYSLLVLHCFENLVKQRWHLSQMKTAMGTSEAVQWLRLWTPSAGGTGLIPDQGTTIPHGQTKIKKKKKTVMDSVYVPARKRSEVAQSCPTFCNPMDYSLPRSSVHGIFQARVQEWVAISLSLLIDRY